MSNESNFHCYLLKSLDPSHPYKTYIGFTTNPERRLRQHNGILKHGGALRTKRAGRPWEFVVVIGGFTDKICALQFEWAWQHPHKSRHVKKALSTLDAHHSKEKCISAITLFRRRGAIAKLNILRLLLTKCSCFQHFAYTIYFFDQQWKTVFMDFCQQNGSVLSSSIDYQITSISTFQNDAQNKQSNNLPNQSFVEKMTNKQSKCQICDETYTEIPIICSNCFSPYHVRCLANFILENTNASTTSIIPKEGSCPTCQTTIIWAKAMSQRRQHSNSWMQCTQHSTKISSDLLDSTSIQSSSISNSSHRKQNTYKHDSDHTNSQQKDNDIDDLTNSNQNIDFDQSIIVLSDSSISSFHTCNKDNNANDSDSNDQNSCSSISQSSLDSFSKGTNRSIDKFSFSMDHYPNYNESDSRKQISPINVIDLLDTSLEDELDGCHINHSSHNSIITTTQYSSLLLSDNSTPNPPKRSIVDENLQQIDYGNVDNENSIIILSDDSTQ